MGFFEILIIAVCIVALLAIRWPALGMGLVVAGLPLLLLAQYYAGLERWAVYFQGFFAMYCVVVAWLAQWDFRRLPLSFLAWGLLMAALLLMGYVYTPSPDYALVKIQQFLALALPLIVGGALVTDTRHRFDRTIAVFLIITIGAYIAHIVFLQSGRISLDRLARYSELGNPIAIARFAGVGVLVFIYLCLTRRGRYILPLWVGALLAGLMIMILTASRGPLLSLFVAVLVTYALRVRRMFIGMVIVGVVVAATAILLVQYAPPAVYDRLVYHTQLDPTGTGRMQIWQLAVQAFTEHPVMGLGTGGFQAYSGLASSYPHNLFLEIISELGIAGVLASALLVLLLVKNFIACLKLRPQLGPRCDFVLSMVVFGFINAMFSADLPVQYALWFGCGMMIGLQKLAENESASAIDESHYDLVSESDHLTSVVRV